MSSSNLAVRLEHSATDAVSRPTRLEVREPANDGRMVKRVRLSTSFRNRKFLHRDQDLHYLLIR
jgi:hypothetical protein